MYNPKLFDSGLQNLTETEHFEKATLISHEIGHHWIGNLVTCKWWNDLWINEAGFRCLSSLRDQPDPIRSRLSGNPCYIWCRH